MKNKPKLLILVLDLKEEPYKTIKEKGIKETWGDPKNIPNNIEIYYYYGNGNNEIIGDEIYTKSKEGLYSIGYKTIEAFNLINKNIEYDYIFRTNTSSYLNLKLLYDKLLEIYNEKLYAGFIGEYKGIKFASGSGYFISKNYVNYILENKNKWDHNLIDDVAINKLLKSEIIKLDRCTINNTNLKSFYKTYHYRCKSKNRINIYGNINFIPCSKDVEIMKKIHEKIYNK